MSSSHILKRFDTACQDECICPTLTPYRQTENAPALRMANSIFPGENALPVKAAMDERC
jgi:hypothetical protein